MRIIKNKQIKEIILRTAANHIVALDALNKAHEKDAISVKQYADAVHHITDNSVEIASIVGGLKGIAMINEIVKTKMDKLRRADNGMEIRRRKVYI